MAKSQRILTYSDISRPGYASRLLDAARSIQDSLDKGGLDGEYSFSFILNIQESTTLPGILEVGYFLVSNMADEYILWAEDFLTNRLTEDGCPIEYNESLGTLITFASVSIWLT